MQQYQERTNCQERKQQRKREEGKAQAVSVTEEDNTHTMLPVSTFVTTETTVFTPNTKVERENSLSSSQKSLEQSVIKTFF